jgi:hypothetical protein
MVQPESRKVPKNKVQAGPKLYGASFIKEYGRLESRRSARFGTVFSVIVMSIEGDGDIPKEVAARVLESVRSSDVAGVLAKGRMAILLPETDYFGSISAIRKLVRSLAPLTGGGGHSVPGGPSRPGGKPPLFSQATFGKDAKGFDGLIGAALDKMQEQERSLRAALDIDNKLFWEIIGDIFSGSCDGIRNATFDAGTGHELPAFFIDRVNEMIIKEIQRNPQRKGILYFSTRKISGELPIIRAIGEAGVTATRIFLAGKYDSDLPGFKNATPVYLDDPRLKETFFTFFLSEDSAYALVLRENWGETYSCFHTSDPYLVEGLIYKFQTEYSLQEQLG